MLEEDEDKVENERYFLSEAKCSDMYDVFQNKDCQIILADDLIVIKTRGENVHIGNYEKDLDFLIDSIIVSNRLKVTMIRTELTTKDFVEKINDLTRYYKHLNLIKKPREKQNIMRNIRPVSYPRIEDIAENLSTSYEINYFNEIRPCLFKKVDFSTAEYYDSNIGRVIIKIATYLISSEDNRFSSDLILDEIKKLRTYAMKELMDSFKKEYIEMTF